MNTKLDDFDIKILNIVQYNNRFTTEQIAEEVGLSPSAVQRRLKRLRDTGIIRAEVAIISPGAVGRKLTVIIEVTLEREQPQILDEFKQSMNATPEVMQCYYVTGKADFILIVTVKDMQDFEDFAYRFFSANPNVKSFHTNVVINTVKFGLTIQLETENPSERKV